MRKLVLRMQVSVDGYVGRASRGREWQVWDWGENCTWDDSLIGKFNAFFEQIDCILFQFYVNPIALHQGLSIFAQKGIDSDLELLGAETFDSGIVLCRYAPRGRA